jgi:hypothetical protein
MNVDFSESKCVNGVLCWCPGGDGAAYVNGGLNPLPSHSLYGCLDGETRYCRPLLHVDHKTVTDSWNEIFMHSIRV